MGVLLLPGKHPETGLPSEQLWQPGQCKRQGQGTEEDCILLWTEGVTGEEAYWASALLKLLGGSCATCQPTTPLLMGDPNLEGDDHCSAETVETRFFQSALPAGPFKVLEKAVTYS